LTENNTKTRPDCFEMEFLDTKQVYRYKVYKIMQQSESVLLKSSNPFAMVVLIARSVFEEKDFATVQERDAALMEIKLRLSRKFLAMSLPKAKIRMIMNFLKSYIHFENTENNTIFDQELQQITGRTETMGIEELILTTERKRAEKRGMESGVEKGVERNKREMVIRMIQKKFTDEIIADIAEVSLEYVQKERKFLTGN
jgi:hypothetical protein